jgi:hypothetical protein
VLKEPGCSAPLQSMAAVCRQHHAVVQRTTGLLTTTSKRCPRRTYQSALFSLLALLYELTSIR